MRRPPRTASGLTGIHDFDSTLALQAFLELEARGELALRVVKGIPHEQLSAAIALGLRTGFGGRAAHPGRREDVRRRRAGAADGMDARPLRGDLVHRASAR